MIRFVYENGDQLCISDYSSKGTCPLWRLYVNGELVADGFAKPSDAYASYKKGLEYAEA